MNLPGGDMCQLIHDIRHNKVGPNPFVPIIALTWSHEKIDIGKIIDAGVDGLLLKPTSPLEIIRYVEAITKDRKLFVVTSSYIGPDRRKTTPRGGEDNLFEVPNTLKTKRNGEVVHLADLTRFISLKLDVVNEQRLKRNAIDISMLLNIVLPHYQSEKVTEQTQVHLKRVEAIAADLMVRTTGTDFEHLSELCENMRDVAGSLVDTYKAPPSKDLKLLKPLSDAILKAFHPDKEEGALAHEISSSVAKFKRFNAA